jgi:hypothetical protein
MSEIAEGLQASKQISKAESAQLAGDYLQAHPELAELTLKEMDLVAKVWPKELELDWLEDEEEGTAQDRTDGYLDAVMRYALTSGNPFSGKSERYNVLMAAMLTRQIERTLDGYEERDATSNVHQK